MKFISLKDTQNICKGWQTHGAVNEDRTVVFTSTPDDFCNFLKGDNPLDKLRDVLSRFTLCPRFENSGGHFGRMLSSNWSRGHGIEHLTQPGELLEKVVGGWCFSGNFHDLSCGFSVYVADRELAKDLLELIIANYASTKYQNAVVGSYRTAAEWAACSNKEEYQSKNVLYYNPVRKGFYVARPNEEELLPVTEEQCKILRQGNWLRHAYLGAERLGARTDVDYATRLAEKLEDILS